MDKVDIQILEILQKDGRATASDIAKDVKLSIPAVSERIKKLIRSNVSGPGHHDLFVKETNWRSKPKQSKTYC